MIGINIKQIRGIVFDGGKIIKATRKAERQVMMRFGAFVRRGARSSIRKRKKPSAPASPPSSHSGVLRKLINFLVTANPGNVVIGPELWVSKRRSGDGAPVAPRQTTPEVLEHGGRVQIVEYQRDFTPRGRRQVERMGRDPDAWYRLGKKTLWHKGGQPLRIRRKRTRVITIAARPFMGPAFEREKPKLPAMWRDSVRA